MSRAINRRTALRGSVAASLGLVAGVASAQAIPTLSANDRRLIELADAYKALDQRCNEHTAAHRYDPTNAADAEFDVLTGDFGPLEEKCAATPADSLVGIIAKARLCRSPTARGCADNDHIVSIADDLWRLHAMGTDGISGAGIGGCAYTFLVTRVSYTISPKPIVRTVKIPADMRYSTVAQHLWDTPPPNDQIISDLSRQSCPCLTQVVSAPL